MELRFYICKHCGNIIVYVKDKGVKVTCCNEEMIELIPNVSEGATEKHLPVINQNGNIVTINVGSIPHPMIDVHYIEWICLVTNLGYYTRKLSPSDNPQSVFYLSENEKVISAYEYCNLHGLWKA